MTDDFLRVASASPKVHILDVEQNVREILNLHAAAVQQKVDLLVLPELCLTGYTIGDYVQHDWLLCEAEDALYQLAKATQRGGVTSIVGLPMAVNHLLYNCAAVLANGRVLAIVPKSNLPTYSEFYENRWYEAWDKPTNVSLTTGGQSCLFGTNTLVDIKDALVGVEICEDLWVPDSPHARLAKMGAVVIANPSASPEEVGKADYRRTIVRAASGKHVLAYVYSGSDMSESTGEVVMSGHRIHAVNGQVVDEVQPFGNDYKLLISDIDIGQLRSERRKRKFPNSFGADVVKVYARDGNDMAYYHVDANPFLPDEDSARRAQRLDTAINIMRWGLIGRLNSVGGKVVIGLSGGLDSALALLVACEAFDQLGLSRTDIHAVVLPGAASSSQTQSNAVKLAQALGVTCRKIPIAQTAGDKLARHGHDGATQDVAYENAQAFQRTDELYTHAAVVGGFLLCTGDLSEMALGWSTYGADQNNGGYNTNCGIPKTMAQALVRHLASQAKYAAASGVLLAVLDTPISPELTKQKGDEISQSTEDIIGPYKLNDFFLYWWFKGQTPETICKKAVLAFGADYDAETIATWLQKFIRRFISAQYKRENVPDGPIVGTVSLSPRGRWRAPADVRFRPPSDEEAQKFVERAVNWANHHN